MASIGARVSNLLINKLDVAFTLGRVFGLLPVLMMSRLIDDTNVLADSVSNYQVALFLATLVLYGGPQVYLIKHGVERRVFVYHMALSTLIMAGGLIAIEMLGWRSGLVMPFVFLVVFRSYYLLYASYLKSSSNPLSYALIGIALISLATFGLTLSYMAATLVCLVLTAGLSIRLGYASTRHAIVAGRRYFTVLRWNSGYFLTFLLQQTYTQITLAAYALFASGPEYLLATHLVYIYALSFIFHSILFRFYLSKMSGQKGTEETKKTLRQSLKISLLLGFVSAVIVLFFYETIELALFTNTFMTIEAAVVLAVMILLTATNVGWSALFMSVKRPFLLAAITGTSTAVVLIGMMAADSLSVTNGLQWAMLAGLSVQAILRTYFGILVVKGLPKKEA